MRLYLGLESMKLGRGGDHKISQLTGVNVKTIAKGRQELLIKNITPERIRKVGAGRPSIKKKTDVVKLLEELMEGDTAGDPMHVFYITNWFYTTTLYFRYTISFASPSNKLIP
ncbi:MAG: hypothetical protein SCARUB_01432 [Candidatus Scalindua rubra]|uniref:Uncharacterized protein n=1 Tax=Candidatus Scalindua rubra TaxID=1872076 RepID=A0A1E3XCM9_9BACT|nr:MAG: hypothetical protein SCARUB_01432 [Candidatus Scalindua rubra]